MKKLLLKIFLILFIINITGCSDSDNVNSSSENYITDFIIEGHQVEFNKETNKITIHVEPSFYNTSFKYKIIGLAPKARTSIPLEGELTISNNTEYFTVYAENGNSRRIEVIVIKKEGITGVKIVNSKNYQVDNKIIIKEDSIDILVDKDLIQSFFPLVAYKFSFTTTPGSHVKEITDVVVGADTPFRITYVSKDGSEKEYTVTMKNFKTNLNYLVMPSITFKTSINYYDHLSSMKVTTRSSTTIPEKYTKGLNPQDHIFLTLETEKEAFKNVKPRIIRTNYKSTISPELDQARDFTKDVIYTITSESGTTTEVKVRTFFEKLITNLPVQYEVIEPDGRVMFRYYAISPIKEIKIINKETSKVLKTSIIENEVIQGSLYQIRLRVEGAVSNELYNMEFTLENNDVILDPIQKIEAR